MPARHPPHLTLLPRSKHHTYAAMEIVHPNSEDEAEHAVPDRRSSDWREPKFWVAVGSLCVVLIGGFWTIASREGEKSRQLAEMNQSLAAISADVRNTRDLVLTNTTKTTADMAAMSERVGKLETAMTAQQQAYNFNFTSRLAAVEARVGIKSKE